MPEAKEREGQLEEGSSEDCRDMGREGPHVAEFRWRPPWGC